MRIPVPDELLPADRLGRVHFVGIGGAALSGIARVMARLGVPVTGSDNNETPFLAALRELDVPISIGYDAANVGDADTLVVTTAAREDNPEVVEGQRRGLRILPRSAGLASVMDGRDVLAVAGTHGKTTTTALLTVALIEAGADPTYAVGGVLRTTGRNADAGQSRWFVAEADESDGAFLVYRPHAAIVTNVEADHLDYYTDGDAVDRAFEEFVATVDRNGFVVMCADDDGARRLAEHARRDGVDVRTYGTSPDADLRLDGLRVSGTTSRYEPVLRGRRLPPVSLAVPGRHLALNSGAALLMGVGLGLDAATLVTGLGGFTGVRRRMELKGTVAGVRVYDDYAHHPTELVAQLTAAREVASGGRLVVAFQPHRYSRTLAFAADFGAALGLADEVVVMEVYAAGEEPVPGATGATVAEAVPLPAAQVRFEPSWTAVPTLLAALAQPGDLVLTLGAGDVTAIGPEVVRLLAGESP